MERHLLETKADIKAEFMISIEELYKPADFGAIDEDAMINLRQLHYKLNCVRAAYGNVMVVDSGFRTLAEQTEIYVALKKATAVGSQHLIGAAADVSDPKGELKKWVLDNLAFIESQYLFMENFNATGGLNSGWVHFQLFSFSSWAPGKSHFFIP